LPAAQPNRSGIRLTNNPGIFFSTRSGQKNLAFGVVPRLNSCRQPVALRNNRVERYTMKTMWERAGEAGKAGWVFLWLIGVPIPVLIILFLLRGCT
jgi:hypothetical protein